MASGRFVKHAVDWARLMEHNTNAHAVRALKAQSDTLNAKMQSYPEEKPAIDWDYYRKQLSNKALVDDLEKQYKADKPAYPVDSAGLKDTVLKEEKQAKDLSVENVKMLNASIATDKISLGKFDLLPPANEITRDMYLTYFPQMDKNKNMSYFPFSQEAQPDPELVPWIREKMVHRVIKKGWNYVKLGINKAAGQQVLPSGK